MNQPLDQLAVAPVFVVGPLRSGSTLLRLLLGHHSKINIVGEFEAAVSQAVGDQWPDMKSYQKFVENDRQTQDLNLSFDPEMDYVSQVRNFLCQLNRRSEKPVIGGSVHSRIDLLPRLWPDARFIHILRDPRDVARSAIGMGWVGNVHEGTAYWLNVERDWDVLCKQVPEHQRIDIKYEDLVSAPVEYLTKICNFLGLEYEENMLMIEDSTTYDYPDPAYSYQWRKKLNPREVVWVEYQCQEKLLERGYKLSGNPIQAPGLLQRLYIKLQNRFYRAAFNIKRLGLGLWLQHVIAKRVGSPGWKRSLKLRINEIERQYLK